MRNCSTAPAAYALRPMICDGGGPVNFRRTIGCCKPSTASYCPYCYLHWTSSRFLFPFAKANEFPYAHSLFSPTIGVLEKSITSYEKQKLGTDRSTWRDIVGTSVIPLFAQSIGSSCHNHSAQIPPVTICSLELDVGLREWVDMRARYTDRRRA